MRLVGAFLVIALASTQSLADGVDGVDDAKPSDSQPPAPAASKPKVPLRVVRMLPETHQALLFDKIKGTHVLADIGKTIAGFVVDDIDDDEVSLTAEGGAQIVLVAPARSWQRRGETSPKPSETEEAKATTKPATTKPAVKDPAPRRSLQRRRLD